jgi:hypothetical protein
MGNRSVWNVGWAVLFGVVIIGLSQAGAQKFRPNYSNWEYNEQKKYYYRYYYYKPGSHHYCIYYPSRGKKMYLYNPDKKRYWGYYDFESKGYSLLPEKDRLEDLNKIPEKAFPNPIGEMPEIPGESGIKFVPPPSDELPKTAP